MRVFRDLDMVEQLGSGVPRILESYPKECFRFMENFTRMTFPINDQVNIEKVRPIGGPIDELTDRQNEVLQLLKENNRLSKRELAIQLAINVSASQAHIDALRAKGYIQRVGGTRGYWKIIK